MSDLYGREYRLRRELLFASLTEDSVCWRCAEPARSGDPFEAGHLVDGDRLSPLGFEHASCNRSAGGKLGVYVGESPASRDWTTKGDFG